MKIVKERIAEGRIVEVKIVEGRLWRGGCGGEVVEVVLQSRFVTHCGAETAAES